MNNILAKSLSTSPEVLEKLADDRDDYVRCNVACHPNCPIKVLEKLANDENWRVRYWVALNPDCSVKALEKLADDEDWLTRNNVAKNLNCPEYIKKFTEAKNYMEKHYEQV